jgi:hypothetical protein
MKRSICSLLAWKRRSKRLEPGAGPERRTRLNPRNEKRRAREFRRTYHSLERVTWVHTRPCRVPGCPNLAECMHIRTGGMGRKDSYTRIADICRDHHWEAHQGVATFQRKYGLDLRRIARELQEAWERVENSMGRAA